MTPKLPLRMLVAAALLAGATTAVAAPMAAPASPGVMRYATTPPGRILQGVEVSPGTNLLFLSGQLASPIDTSKPMSAMASMTMADFGDSQTQTVSALTKIKGILASHGYAMSDIIKMTLFIAADPKLGKMDFDGVNKGFAQFFNTSDNPNTVARSAIQVAALAAPMFLVEIEVTAAKTK